MEMTRRQFGKRSLLTVATLAITPSLLTLEGCPNLQSTLEGLVGEVGTGVTALLTYLGNTSAATEAAKLFADALAAVKSWTTGTIATDVINALNDALAFLADIPGLSAYAGLVQLIVGTVENIITILTNNSPAPATTAALRPRSANVPVVNLAHPPQNASQFKKAWNILAPKGATL
jgi:hypothetical protein